MAGDTFGKAAIDNPVTPCGLGDEPPHWVEIELVDDSGFAVAYEEYEVTLPDGEVVSGYLDAEGFQRFATTTPGECIVKFPRLDTKAWRYKESAGPKVPPFL